MDLSLRSKETGPMVVAQGRRFPISPDQQVKVPGQNWKSMFFFESKQFNHNPPIEKKSPFNPDSNFGIPKYLQTPSNHWLHFRENIFQLLHHSHQRPHRTVWSQRKEQQSPLDGRTLPKLQIEISAGQVSK